MVKVSSTKRNFIFTEYLGPNGVGINEYYNLYLQKCAEFKRKANKIKQENSLLKKSTVPKVYLGYEPNELFERRILEQRKEQWDYYLKIYDVETFYQDKNQMYEHTNKKSKRIRIIRSPKIQENKEEFSEDFEKGNESWFTRYCILSKFVQAARLIVVNNRMLKNLEILKTLTPKKVARLMKNENTDKQSFKEIGDTDLSETSFKDVSSKQDSRIKPVPCLTLPCGKCQSKKKNTENIPLQQEDSSEMQLIL